jgi:hypothetical protein
MQDSPTGGPTVDSTSRNELRVRKTTVTLSDGRALMYFGAIPERPADYPDRRQLAPVPVQSQARWDRLLGEWVVVAGHRQDRTFQPADDQCPLCPSSANSHTEIPAPENEVVVFENRFPTLKTASTGSNDQSNGAWRDPAAASAPPAAHLTVSTRLSAPVKSLSRGRNSSRETAWSREICV